MSRKRIGKYDPEERTKSSDSRDSVTANTPSASHSNGSSFMHEIGDQARGGGNRAMQCILQAGVTRKPSSELKRRSD